jgi:hypothetical protein
MPNRFFLHPLNIQPWAYNSVASKFLIGGDDSISDASDIAYPSANLAIYIPFFLQTPMVIDRIFWGNGATLSGNVDAGVYDAARKKIVSTGSTAQASTTDAQSVNITNVTLGTGLFFLAIAMDNTAGTLMAVQMGAGLHFYKTLGIYQQASAFPLPDTATFSLPTFNYLPIVGITPRSSI